ncbi:hypothetical protein [Tsukamurella soli]|uniref:Uncharacterized protein n=1 Tax=Tsukamurella soli TaxID=644556 RepID=A0ABP8JZY7_9ACTN
MLGASCIPGAPNPADLSCTNGVWHRIRVRAVLGGHCYVVGAVATTTGIPGVGATLTCRPSRFGRLTWQY